MISTAVYTDTPEDRAENLKKLREFHKKTINDLGISSFYLLGKLCYNSPGKAGEKVVSFFFNEISKGQDVFIEFTNRYNVPEFAERTLYKWEFNPHFEEEYEKTNETDLSKVRYLIPVDELKVIKSYPPTGETKIETETQVFDFGIPNPDLDPPLNEITIRDLAAIILGKPVSNKEWLNEIINKK